MARSAAEQSRDALSATLFIFRRPIFRQHAELSAALTSQSAFHFVDLLGGTQNC
jgi:hypothetical protein